MVQQAADLFEKMGCPMDQQGRVTMLAAAEECKRDSLGRYCLRCRFDKGTEVEAGLWLRACFVEGSERELAPTQAQQVDTAMPHMISAACISLLSVSSRLADTSEFICCSETS